MQKLDSEALRERLQKMRTTQEKARTRAAEIEKRLKAADRRKETQMLCVLGRALIRMVEEDPSFAHQTRDFLISYVTRETDVAALKGTRFDVSVGRPEIAKC